MKTAAEIYGNFMISFKLFCKYKSTLIIKLIKNMVALKIFIIDESKWDMINILRIVTWENKLLQIHCSI